VLLVGVMMSAEAAKRLAADTMDAVGGGGEEGGEVWGTGVGEGGGRGAGGSERDKVEWVEGLACLTVTFLPECAVLVRNV